LISLLERVAGGDEAAVELCAKEYGGLVYRLAMRYLDQARDEVEDAVQDVFIEIWTSAKRFDPAKGSESAFVATIAHRRIIDRQRQVSARRRTLRGASESLKQSPVDLPESGVTSDDDRAVLAQVYSKLPENEREAIWLSVYGGLTHHEIGIATDSPVGTIKSRLRRAMIRMSTSVLERKDQCCSAGQTLACEGGGES